MIFYDYKKRLDDYIFSGWTKDVIDNEIDFTISKIKYAIDNESVWNYLRAIIKHDLLEYEKGTLKFCTP